MKITFQEFIEIGGPALMLAVSNGQNINIYGSMYTADQVGNKSLSEIIDALLDEGVTICPSTTTSLEYVGCWV